MAMVDVDGSSLPAYGGLKGQVGWVGLRVGGHLALSLHSSNEPSECCQWSRHMTVVLVLLGRIAVLYVCRCGLLSPTE